MNKKGGFSDWVNIISFLMILMFTFMGAHILIAFSTNNAYQVANETNLTRNRIDEALNSVEQCNKKSNVDINDYSEK